MNVREEIKIFWEGPFKIDDILEDKINEPYEVRASGQGIYQIYASHPLYGNDVLVYIGRTKDANGFKSRLKGRWVIENGSDAENVRIYLGTIFSDSKKIKDDSILIDKSEVLLINAMKPAYNSSNIQSANEDLISDNFILHNEGNYKNLYPVLDSKYFWEPYQNFALINKVAKIYKRKKIYDEETYYGFTLNDNDKFKIWLCVDYEIWDVKKIPFVLEIESEDIKLLNELEKNKLFTKYTYQDKEEGDIYYFEITDECLNLSEKTLESICNEKVNYINEVLK